MIEYQTGDLLQADVDALVNTVNCMGIMGRGIALQFKNYFPANFKAYAEACRREEVQPGHMHVFETNALTTPKYIINFPTKRHWRGKSRIEDIDAGLTDLAKVIQQRGIHSIALPPLGSGLGGLDWADVRPRIEAALGNLADVRVLVYEPHGVPEQTHATVAPKAPKMTEGRAALILLMQRYLSGLMAPFVTLLEVQKLLYFMQEAGKPLKLNYEKGHYGPYAREVSHVLKSVEGYYTTGYLDGGDDPTKQLEIVPGAVQDAEQFLKNDADIKERFDRVAELVDGFETPFGLELLATVHWVMSHEQATRSEEIIYKTHAWNEKKKKFTPEQIQLAQETLVSKGWAQMSLKA